MFVGVSYEILFWYYFILLVNLAMYLAIHTQYTFREFMTVVPIRHKQFEFMMVMIIFFFEFNIIVQEFKYFNRRLHIHHFQSFRDLLPSCAFEYKFQLYITNEVAADEERYILKCVNCNQMP